MNEYLAQGASVIDQQSDIIITYRITHRIGPPRGTGSAWSQADFKNPVDDPSLCNLCSFPLKMFNDEACLRLMCSTC